MIRDPAMQSERLAAQQERRNHNEGDGSLLTGRQTSGLNSKHANLRQAVILTQRQKYVSTQMQKKMVTKVIRLRHYVPAMRQRELAPKTRRNLDARYC